jgi:hypothetical protein
MKTNRKHYEDKHFDAIAHDSSVSFAKKKLSDEEIEAKRVEDAEYCRDNCRVLAGFALVVLVVSIVSWVIG